MHLACIAFNFPNHSILHLEEGKQADPLTESHTMTISQRGNHFPRPGSQLHRLKILSCISRCEWVFGRLTHGPWHSVGAGRRNKYTSDGRAIRHSSQVCRALKMLCRARPVWWGDVGEGNLRVPEPKWKPGDYPGHVLGNISQNQSGLEGTGAGDSLWHKGVAGFSLAWLKQALMLRRKQFALLL